jgi:hypothetical protein
MKLRAPKLLATFDSRNADLVKRPQCSNQKSRADSVFAIDLQQPTFLRCVPACASHVAVQCYVWSQMIFFDYIQDIALNLGLRRKGP